MQYSKTLEHAVIRRSYLVNSKSTRNSKAFGFEDRRALCSSQHYLPKSTTCKPADYPQGHSSLDSVEWSVKKTALFHLITTSLYVVQCAGCRRLSSEALKHMWLEVGNNRCNVADLVCCVLDLLAPTAYKDKVLRTAFLNGNREQVYLISDDGRYNAWMRLLEDTDLDCASCLVVDRCLENSLIGLNSRTSGLASGLVLRQSRRTWSSKLGRPSFAVGSSFSPWEMSSNYTHKGSRSFWSHDPWS